MPQRPVCFLMRQKGGGSRCEGRWEELGGVDTGPTVIGIYCYVKKNLFSIRVKIRKWGRGGTFLFFSNLIFYLFFVDFISIPLIFPSLCIYPLCLSNLPTKIKQNKI